MQDAGVDATVMRLEGTLHGFMSLMVAVLTATSRMLAAMAAFLREI